MKRLLFVLLALLCPLIGLLGAVALLLAPFCSLDWARRLAVSFDQLANTVAGGSEDETISSRAAKAARAKRWWGCVLCRLLHVFDRDHCERSIEADEGDPVT